jgi:hypothetical protein
MQIHRDPQEIVFRTDGQVLRHHKDSRGESLGARLCAREIDWDESPEEPRQITFRELTQNGLIALLRVHGQDLCGEL